MTDEPIRGMSPIAGLIEEFADSYDKRREARKAELEAIHRADMKRANERFGANMMARGEDGIYRPTDIPVEFGPGLEALS